MPPKGVKQELGLGEPKKPGSTEQADKFKSAYQASAGPINTALQYTATYAQKSKHDPLAARRDKSCQAYQVALARIDPTNPAKAQGAIDQVLAAVKQLQSDAENLKTAAEKAYTDWTTREGDFNSLTDKIREMVEWGHDKAGALQTVIDAIRGKANERAYEEALKALEQLTSKAEPIYADYQKQKEAQGQYETGLAELQLRLDSAQSSLQKPLEQAKQELAAATETMKQSATAKDYVTALSQLQTLKGSVEAFEQKAADLAAKKKEYEDARKGLEPKLSEATTSKYKALSELDGQVLDLMGKTDAAAAEEDYEKALSLNSELSGKADEKLTRVKEIDAKKEEYEQARTTLDPKLAEAATCQEDLDLTDIDAQIADLTAKTDAAAADQDYEQAVTLVNELSAKVEEKSAAIEEKKKEYETARATLDGRMATVSACKYKELEAQKTALEAGVKPIDEAATGQKYSTALKLANELLAKIDEFEKAKTAHEDKLKAEINKKLAPVKSKLGTLKDTESPIKGTVEKLIASIEAAVGGSGDLEQAGKDVDEAAKQMAELEQVQAVRKRLEDALDENGEAKKVIDELEKNGKLASLPMEARNVLVEKLMDGTISADDDKAIQKVFKIPAIDRRFEEKDKATRDKILKAYADDPEVKKIREDWSTMTEDQKKAAVKKLAEIPVGPDGWNVGMPANFTWTNEARSGPPDNHILFGSYNYQSDTMSVNLHNDATINKPSEPTAKDPVELLDTIAHELGHKYQRKLVTDLENDKLKPGDAEYEQAKAFQLHEQYKSKSPDGFKKIYSTSPKEAHSRKMGSEIQDGLKKAPKADDHEGHDH